MRENSETPNSNGGIFLAILCGHLGWRAPLALGLQLVVQFLAVKLLMPVSGAMVTVACLLVFAHLYVGASLGAITITDTFPASKRSGSKAAGYLEMASESAVVLGGLSSLVILGATAFFIGAALGTFCNAFALSWLVGTIVHLCGVALPIYGFMRKKELKYGKPSARSN